MGGWEIRIGRGRNDVESLREVELVIRVENRCGVHVGGVRLDSQRRDIIKLGRLVSGKGERGSRLTFRLKSPNSPQLLGVADGAAKVEVADEVFKYNGVELKLVGVMVEDS